MRGPTFVQLNGSTFVVVGASGSVGDATIRRFHAAGARLVVLDADLELERTLAAELGASAVFRHLGPSDGADVRVMLRQARERVGPANGIVHFTGVSAAEYPDLDGAELLSQLSGASLVRPFDLIRSLVAAMGDSSLAGGASCVVNVAAPPGPQGQVETPSYAACKAAMLLVSLALARELANTRTRVISVAAGPYDKPSVAAWPPEAAKALGRSVRWPSSLESASDYASLVQHLVEYEPTRDSDRAEGLSQRELEVLQLLAQGRTNKDIARILGISARTVQVHTSKIYGKIGVANRTSAVLWLAEHQAKMQAAPQRPFFDEHEPSPLTVD